MKLVLWNPLKSSWPKGSLPKIFLTLDLGFASCVAGILSGSAPMRQHVVLGPVLKMFLVFLTSSFHSGAYCAHLFSGLLLSGLLRGGNSLVHKPYILLII